jgi:uncharacterized protein
MTITEPQAASSTAILDGLKIIDSDSHFTEPPDLWLSRGPASWKDRLPTQRTIDGKTHWFLDGQPWASIGGNTLKRGREKVLGEWVMQPFDAIDPCAWRVKERLELLDDIGIYAQVLYPNGIGFSSNHIFAIEDLEQRSVVLQTLNDFYIDVQHESDDRLLPQAMLPIWDMDFTVREMTRLVDKGIRGFTLSDRPELLGLPELNAPYFDPMWDMFNSTRSVTNFHIGSGNRRDEVEARRAMMLQAAPSTEMPKVANPSWSSFGPMRQLAVTAILGYMSNARIIVNMIVSDLFDRFENLKIVSAESGIGWIPFLIESCEWQLDEMVVSPSEVGLTKRRPREYFQDHFYVMFWFERHGPQHAIEAIGVNNVLVETDIPHPTCKYPGAREHFADVLSGLDSHTVRRVLQDNAAEIYKLAV